MEQVTWIGRSLKGRYKINELVGRGGMSAVYKATDPNLKRDVAIKLIHSHFSNDGDFIRRFQTEAASVAALHHTNIVQVYDFDNEDENYYMVMEHIPGGTLQEHLDFLRKTEEKLPINRSVRIILDICEALEYAHNKEIIHRDIKPANIMLDDQGRTILMDFGLVKILNATSHTATGAIIGTARYMPPEIIRNELPDKRSDIYSLGVTFYQMLSGDLPFHADSVISLMMKHLHDPVPDLSASHPSIPQKLVRIVNKAMEKDRGKRYQSANEMADDLRRFLSTLETVSVSLAFSSSQKDMPLGYLKLKLADGSRYEFQVSKSEVTIGRNPTNDIIIQDEKMSRSHARFEFDAEGKVRIFDTESTNGVRVNGIKITRAVITPRDVVQIGDCQFQFEPISDMDKEMITVESVVEPAHTLVELKPTKELDDSKKDRIVVSTPDKTWEVLLDDTVKEISIGRGKNNDVVIDHPSVSRTHARIIRDHQAFKLEDTNSINGLIVMGKRLDEVTLKPGMTVELGYASLVLQSGMAKESHQSGTNH